MEEAASLSKGKEVDILFAEADGVFVHGTEKKSMEVHHAIVYEGWDMNGKRVSIRQPKVIMTTVSSDAFWKEVQAFAAHHYSLEKAQIVTNSDGGKDTQQRSFKKPFHNHGILS